jgi:hypothetical protein
VITLTAAVAARTPALGPDAGEGGTGDRLSLPVSGPALVLPAHCHGVRVNTATVRAGTVNEPVPFA